MCSPAEPSARGLLCALALVVALVAGCGSRGSSAAVSPSGASQHSATASNTAAAPQPKQLDASGKLKGNAGGMNFPAGRPGQLSVIEVGPPNLEFGGYLPVLVRNNTDKTYLGVDIPANGVAANGQGIGRL